jgi:hypothetical protein
MRFFASPPLRAGRLIVAAAIAVTVFGGIVAAAAPAGAGLSHSGARGRPAQSVTFIWHTLPLINGWESASKGSLVTGTPAWAISGGVVYLRGAIKQPTPGGSPIFAQLPQYPAPTRNLYLQVWTTNDVPGILYVGADGTLEAYAGNANTFTSLAAVSYPASAIKPRKLTLEHGWQSSQPIYGTGDPSYAISGGVVYLSGSMHTGGTSHVATLLPKAARPAHLMFVLVYTFGGTPGWLQILPTGQIEAFGPAAADYTSLAGVSYPATGAKWHSFALTDGWKSGLTRFRTATPAYTVIAGVVHLAGSMYEATGNVGLWTTLPVAARTAADVLEIAADTSGGHVGAMAITNRLGLVSSVPFSNAKAFTSLDGIAYPQSS